MKLIKAQELTLIAILTALTLVLGKVFQFSLALGFFTLLDVGIYFTAFFLGKRQGALVGGLSGFLIDLISGYPQYMLVSLAAHGLQGYLAGWRGRRQVLGLVLASLVMVSAYFAAETVFYGFSAALLTLAPNTLQNLVGMGLGYALAQLAHRTIK